MRPTAKETGRKRNYDNRIMICYNIFLRSTTFLSPITNYKINKTMLVLKAVKTYASCLFELKGTEADELSTFMVNYL